MKKQGIIMFAIIIAAYFFHAGQEREVYITKTGHRYHYDLTCPGLKRAKEIKKIQKQVAEMKGYSLCKIEQRDGDK